MCGAWLVCVMLTSVVLGQAPVKTPAFEVSSVRALPPGKMEQTELVSVEGGSFVVKNATMQFLISLAYNVPHWNMAGQPDWLETREYDVTARPGGEGTVSYETTRLMLQQLLQERFHLALHRETQERAGYAMVLAKGGLKLKPGREDGKQGFISSNRLHRSSLKLKQLAEMLAIPAGKPVVDRTGVTGTYDVDLRFAPEDATDSTLPSLVTALEEQAGLKLEPQKVPVEVLVIDHVESEPTEN